MPSWNCTSCGELELVIDFRRVETQEDFRRALVEFQPHIILSDFSMPAGFDGLTALDLAREQLPTFRSSSSRARSGRTV